MCVPPPPCPGRKVDGTRVPRDERRRAQHNEGEARSPPAPSPPPHLPPCTPSLLPTSPLPLVPSVSSAPYGAAPSLPPHAGRAVLQGMLGNAVQQRSSACWEGGCIASPRCIMGVVVPWGGGAMGWLWGGCRLLGVTPPEFLPPHPCWQWSGAGGIKSTTGSCSCPKSSPTATPTTARLGR